ncbi:hypothetical protein Vretimale_19785 [Volvox reticuliferus]|uniref:C-type lectin domain-containing protein n=3 Tax=Volvox reticuliferus TaxID=1737510 RepID=A0A8J4H011_9CHLO|nr:hypothetical protein Vretimale_19785 [Volvox reticuliferus]
MALGVQVVTSAGRGGIPSSHLLLSMAALLVVLGAIMPRCIKATACETYNKETFFNPFDGHNYTLYGSYNAATGCVGNFTTAKDTCEKDGLELAPQAEPESRFSLRKLCAVGKRVTCWLDGVPPEEPTGRCYVMSQEGDIHVQGCEQPVRFVCRSKHTVNTKPLDVLSLSTNGYDYVMYTRDATVRTTHSGAAQFCQSLGSGWDLVPYWESSSNAWDVLTELCAANGYTCWCKRDPAVDVNRCPLIAQDGTLQMQGCEQDVRFVCRKAWNA